MNNADMPAMAMWTQDMNIGLVAGSGLTKREQACLTMGVADTGDAELDAIITKGNKNKFAGLAMQGLLAGGYCIDDSQNRLNDVPSEAINLADALLKQLEQDND